MKILSLTLLLLSFYGMYAQNCAISNNIGGTVYGDFNTNGINDENLTGQAGVTVRAYNNSGTIVSQSVTNRDGKYLLLVPNGQKVRVEFTNLPAGLYPSFYGTNNGTTVQFITSPTCAADLGLTNNESHAQDNPKVISPIFVNGNPLAGGTAGQRNALVGVDYTATGTNPAVNVLSQSNLIGSIWGTAWDKKDQQLFLSAVVKRHTGTGPLGIGGIYRVTGYPGGSATIHNYIDLSTCINLGTVSRPDLPAGVLTSNRDDDVYSKTGKVGLGGLAASLDGTTLWTVNLNSKTLVKIQIRNSPSSPLKTTITCSDVTEYPIPSACGANTRPWAVAWHDNQVYVGTVCDNASLNANAYTFNPTTSTFSAPVLSFSVKESATFNKGCTTFSKGCEWNAWNNTYPTNIQGFALEVIYPQPIFSDIDFDGQGNMVLGFIDRFGNQTGFNNYFKPGDNTLYSGNSGGDSYYAYNNNGTFIFERNGDLIDGSGNVLRDGSGNNPTEGLDFFAGDQWQNIHHETSVGTNAVHRGRGEVIGGVFDAITAFSGGLLRATLQNGSGVAANELYKGAGASFGKAAGLGDVELLAENAPIQVGNYVWNDKDEDGLQDPNEAPLNGIDVQLINAAGAVLANTTTNTQGQYYFSSTTTPTILPNTSYYIVLTNYTASGVNNYYLTTANAAGTNDDNDNDGTVATSGVPASVLNKAYIPITTGDFGANNHSYDFGLAEAKCATEMVLNYGNGNSCATVNGTKVIDFTAQITWQYVTVGQIFQVQASGGFSQNFTATTASGVISIPLDNVSFPSGTVTVTNLSAPTCTQSLPYSYPNYLTINNIATTACAFNSATASSTSTVTATINWQGLNVGDVLTVATSSGQSTTIAVTAAAGSQAISIPILADASIGTLTVNSQQKNCASTAASYTAPAPCPQCALQVGSVALGDCSGSGPYTSPMDVTVFWANATIGNSINVTVNHVGGPSVQTINNIATSTGSQTLTFTVPADGSTNNAITLAWTNGATCNITGTTYNARPTCNQKYDVALTKTVSTSSANVGDFLTFTIAAYNQGNQLLTNIDVSDVLPSGFTYISNSVTNGTYNTGTNIWTMPSLGIGQNATLTLLAQVATGAKGVYYNTAEVTAMSETDIDSSPNNQNPDEDDLDRACVSVPIKLCGNATFLATAEAGFYNYQWYKNGVILSGETNPYYLITGIGTYHYVATVNPGGGNPINFCCPIVVQNTSCTCELTTEYTMAQCVQSVVTEPTTTLSVTANWSDASTTSNTLFVNVNGIVQTLPVTSAIGSHVFTFSIPTNGSAVFINASFSQGGCMAPTINTTAPVACPSCSLSVTGLVVGTCNSPLNTHSLAYTVNWTGLSVGDVIQISGGGGGQNLIAMTNNGSQTFTTTVAATGDPQDIVVQHIGTLTCQTAVSYTSPSPCPPCSIAVNYIVPSACYYTSTSLQDVEVGFEWVNATTSTVSVTINGQTLTYNTGGDASGKASVKFVGLPSNGATFPVSVQLGATCTATSSYTSSNQCLPCTLSISNATTGACSYNPLNQNFVNALSVTTTWTNALPGTAIKFLATDPSANPDTTSYYFFIEPTYSLAGGTVTVTFPVPSTGNPSIVSAAMMPDYIHCFTPALTYNTLGVPNAGANVNATTDNLNLATATPSGGTWTALTGNPAAATINASGQISGMVVAGNYFFTYTIGGGCSDTVQVTRLAGSIGNYAWNDLNSNGLNDEPTTEGINGLSVQLWSAGVDGVIGGGDDVQVGANTTTANDGSGNPGYYNFVVMFNGNYYVKFPTTNSGKVVTTQTTTAATDNNSDADVNGNSPVFALNLSGTSTAKDNPTIDVGYKCNPPCAPITIQKTK